MKPEPDQSAEWIQREPEEPAQPPYPYGWSAVIVLLGTASAWALLTLLGWALLRLSGLIDPAL